MPAPGSKPKDQKHGRTPGLDWVEVADVPFAGWRPDLPEIRQVEWVSQKDGRHVADQPLRAETQGWWDSVSTMPHCTLWSKSDWMFALGTAFIADMMFCGDRQAAGELRQREKIMGTTLDARRDLRIRYVESAGAKSSAPVVNMNTRRSQLTAGA